MFRKMKSKHLQNELESIERGQITQALWQDFKSRSN